MVHAGIHPDWDIDQAVALGREVEDALRGPRRDDFLRHMYGNGPARWSASLTGWDRLRFVVNAMTRMRYVDADGALDLEHTGPPGTQPPHLVPWYEAPWRKSRGERVVFGHWATLRLDGDPDPALRVFHLDTGCVWGGELTAMRLEDGRYFSVRSSTTKL